MSKKEEKPGDITGEPDYLKESTEAMKQCLAQRKEISQDLAELEEKCKTMQGTTADCIEEDENIEKEFAQLQEQINSMKEKFKPFLELEAAAAAAASANPKKE